MDMKQSYVCVAFLLLFVTSITTLSAQERLISGMVTDASSREALPGVNIILKGTQKGTETDFDGKYSIKAKTGDVLVFSFVGMKTIERKVSSSNNLSVKMESDNVLEEVVVTGSASGKSIKELSFSIGQVKKGLLENVPATTATGALQGKISGVSVSPPGGQPGGDVSIQLRTANSLSTGQNPLVIVDGVILEGGLADINTEDIDRIEIAKGAAGASLYGSRASNGVIQIFTKRGKNNDIKVSYRGEFGFKQITSKYDLATTHRFKLTPDGSAFDLSSGSRQVDADGISDNPYPGTNYDYQDMIFRKGAFTTHHASISGGNDKTSFLFSYQRLSDEGTFRLVDDYTRDNFRLNLDNKITDKVKVKSSFFYSNSDRDASVNSGIAGAVLFTALITEPIYDWNAPNEEDGSPYNYDSNIFDPNIRNPFYTLSNNERTEERNRVLANVALDYDILPWLSVNGAYSFDYENNTFENYIPKGYLSDNPSGNAQNVGFIERSNFNGRSQNVRFNTLFSNLFGDDSDYNLNVRLSYLHERYNNEFNGAEGYDLAVSGITSLDNIKGRPIVSSFAQEILTDSYFAVADFDYKSKYIFSGVFRREGSSLFGPNTRWANYFRTSFAYRLTEDVEIPGVQELKLRGSYGTAGIRPTYEMRFETFTLQNGAAFKTTVGNNDLKPAKTGELELGLNIDFLDKFSFEFNYVKSKTEDQILRVPLSAVAGFSAQWRNAGEIDATTYEASLNYNAINNDNWKWDIGVVWDKSEQKVSKLDVPAYLTGPGTQESTIFRIEEGQNFGIMYGNQFITSLSELPSNLNRDDYTVNSAGYVVKATGGTPVKRVDSSGNEFFVIGDITPDFRMGFNTTLSYKNFSLYALVDWKKGGDVYNKTKQWLYRDGRHTDVTSGLPYNFYQDLYNTNLPSSAFVEDASFVKLRELSLYYTVDGNVLGDIIDEVKFGFVGRNLFVITDYSGLDRKSVV